MACLGSLTSTLGSTTLRSAANLSPLRPRNVWVRAASLLQKRRWNIIAESRDGSGPACTMQSLPVLLRPTSFPSDL